jgi:hypothetical protein
MPHSSLVYCALVISLLAFYLLLNLRASRRRRQERKRRKAVHEKYLKRLARLMELEDCAAVEATHKG